jgi:hypothetical protein
MSWSATELDGAASALGEALDQPEDLLKVERALALLAGCPASPRPELARQARELLATRAHHPAGLLALPVRLWASDPADRSLVPLEEPQAETCWPIGPLLWRRCVDVAGLIADGVQLPLLSTPSTADLTVHPHDLAERLDAWRAAGRPIDEVDLVIALHRLRPDLTPHLPASLFDPTDPIKHLVRTALGDESARPWDLPSALVQEALEVGGLPPRRSVDRLDPLHVGLAAPLFDSSRPGSPVVLHTVPAHLPALSPSRLRTRLIAQALQARQGTPEHDEMPEARLLWSGSLCPRDPSPFAAWTFVRLWEGREDEVDHAVIAALRLLAEVPGRLGPWGARAMLAGMAGRHPDHGPVVVALTASALTARRVTTTDLAAALHEQLATKAVPPARYLPALQSIAAHGRHHLHAVLEVLQGALAGSPATLHRQIGPLIDLWHSLHAQAGRPPLSRSNRDFLDNLSPSSRAGRAARELLEAVEGLV